MPARRSVVCDVCGVVVDFGKSDCGVVWEVARKVAFVFECRRCRDHEELKNEVVALRQRVRELEGEKSSIGVQTEASDDVKRDDRTLREVGGGGEVGQVEQVGQVVQVEQVEQGEQVEQVEQVQVTEEAMVQVRGTGRDGGRLYADVVRERRVSTANRFQLLQGEQKRDEVIYMGDSIVRKIDRTVCRGRKEKTTTVCLPGAMVDDVRMRVGQVMGPGTGGSICVHVGTNDADKEGTTAIVGKFRALVRELKARRVGTIWISGILPVMGGRKGYRNCRRMSINSQLDGMCRQEKVGFVDLWATFAGRPDLYRKDGLHMTDRGAEVLGAGLARAMGSGGAPLLN